MTDAPPDIAISLPRAASAAGLARARLAGELTGRIARNRLDTLLIVVTELVANAVVHGRGAIQLRLWISGGDLRGEVIDQGSGFAHQVREVGVEEAGGRGLLLVQALTRRWGVEEGTTHVWFELPVE